MDQLLRGLDSDKAIRVVVATTTDLVREAARRHDLHGAAAVVLGRALTAGCLLATLTKGADERVRIGVRGSGPLGRLLVDAHGDGRVRGCYPSDRPSATRLPVGSERGTVGVFVGEGEITVTRDLGLENTYQGVVALRSGEIDEDLERYLSDSEQLPSVLRCHVEVDAEGTVVRAAGVLAQTFPGSDPARLDGIREALAGDGLADVLRQDRDVEALVGFALLGGEVHGAHTIGLSFSCPCGHGRALSVVSTLGADDIDALADERGGTEVRCHFCGDVHPLSERDLRELAATLRAQVN